jgi:TRAP transporter 4TM/12TM fusion protein
LNGPAGSDNRAPRNGGEAGRGVAGPPAETQRPGAAAGDEPQAARAAAEIVEEAERGTRHCAGAAGVVAACLAAAWALFQLSLPELVILSSDYVRAIHLVFAIALVYLSFPALKKRRTKGALSFLSARDRLPGADVVLAVLAGGAAAYYAVDYVGISARQGTPLVRDIAVGLGLIVLLLEAARRSLGLALPIVAGTFLVYGLLGQHMPALLAFRGVSLQRLVGQLTLSQEGVYGVPLRVSASTVFLFVLLGAMLEKSGGGRYFVQLAYSLLGRFRGGPAKAAVLSSGLTGMVSGSSIANVVTTGTFTIPLMKKSGYPPQRAAAIEVAASTNGQLMPPIMGAAAFIIAEYCQMEYLAVVRAAFLPAVVSYVALIYITHLEACKLGLRGLPKAELPRFFPVLLSGAHFLVPLGVLVWMLLAGNSPERSAFYAIVVLAGLIVVREPLAARRAGGTALAGLRRAAALLARSLVSGGRGMMGVAVACATAGIIVGVVSLGPGQRITHIVEVLSGGNILLILLMTAVASLIIGMGLPTTATYIVMASLTARVIVELAAKAGFEVPVLAAHLFCFYFGILADDTPPVGLAAYAGAAIARAKPIPTGVRGFLYDLRTAILPFMFVFNTDLLLWNVDSWWRIAVIFAAATVAMLAFAALTQNFLVIRNRLYESALLVAAMLVLLRPQILHDALRWPTVQAALPEGLKRALAALPLDNKLLWYGVGTAMFVGTYLLQRLRKRRRAEPAAAGHPD